MRNFRVLILDGYTRQTLPMVEGFKHLGCEVTIGYFSKLDVGYVSRYPDKRICFNCEKDDYAKQYEITKNLIVSGNFDLVVPMTDYSAMYLSKNKEFLARYARIAVNDWPIFEMAINKSKTMQICAKYNIPSPRTVFSDNVLNEIKNRNIAFPVVIKPNTACGSIGYNIVENEEKLTILLSDYNYCYGPLLVQEYIPSEGMQYNVHMFIDKEGHRKAAVASVKNRWFPLDGGAATCVQTIKNDRLLDQCELLLQTIGWNGYADIDLISDPNDGQIKVLEINPRISANVKLCFYVGINIAQLIYENEFTSNVSNLTEYKTDHSCRCTLTDFLWFIKSKKRFSSNPSWFDFRRTCDSVFSWKDPLPSIAFCIQSAKNYRNAMDQRNRR
jgi:D-aspartate ligase